MKPLTRRRKDTKEDIAMEALPRWIAYLPRSGFSPIGLHVCEMIPFSDKALAERQADSDVLWVSELRAAPWETAYNLAHTQLAAGHGELTAAGLAEGLHLSEAGLNTSRPAGAPLSLASLDVLPATPEKAMRLSEMSVEQLGQAFGELEKVQGQYESLSGMCATLAGLVLTEVKKKVGHGRLAPWLNKNFPKARRTAQLYMQLAGMFSKCAPRCAFDQLTLSLLDSAQGLDGQSLDLQHPLVAQVSKWTKGRSFYQLRQEELVQGGNQHPKCPHCEGDLASKTQEFCPHCGKATGQHEKTQDEVREELVAQTRVWVHNLLSDTHVEKGLYRLLPDHEARAAAIHFREMAQKIDEWVKTPERARQEMALEDILNK